MTEVDSVGSHVLLDYVNYEYERNGEDEGEWVLGVLRESTLESGVREVHSHVEVFDGKESPPGFAAVVLIDESHVTAHCYSDRGLLAIAVFTCGDNNSDSLADLIHQRLVSEIPMLSLVFRKNVRRFRSD